MNKYFKILDSNNRVDIIEYVVNKLSDNPYIKLYIGSDSQNYGGYTHYSTVVVLRYNKNGGHVLYQKDKVPRIRDHWSRLWGECERSLEVARYLKEVSSINVEAVELDYNNEKKTESTKLVAATKGYVNSFGFTVKVKPEELIAVKAADYLCRH
jgi:predicted RNase H-related nuclease YkuK (DUF458 family)